MILGLAAQTGSENLQFLLDSITNKPVQQHRISVHHYFKKLSLSAESYMHTWQSVIFQNLTILRLDTIFNMKIS